MAEDDPMVFDIGSDLCRAGLSSDFDPKIMLNMWNLKLPYLANKERYVGNEAQEKREIQNISCPIKQGIITNWEDMEKIWHHLYKELHVSPQDRALLMTEAPLNPRVNREKIAQIMFETFNVPALYVGMQPLLALFATGHLYGMIVHSGDGVTCTMPSNDCMIFKNAIKRLDVAGRNSTEFLEKLLAQRGYSVNYESAKEIKEKFGYVTADFSAEALNASQNTDLEKMYKLPDGTLINLGKERFQCSELVFQPSLLGMENEGIHKMAYESVLESPVDSRWDLYGKMCISGGNTMFPGFAERFQKELRALAPPSKKIHVLAPADRKDSVWTGASVFGSLSVFPHRCLCKEDYEEFGPSRTNKFF